MNPSRRTEAEIIALANLQVFTLEKDLAKGYYNLDTIGSLLPGSIMVHNMAALSVAYMNQWGCDQLLHSLEELQEMGPVFFEKFLVAEEARRIIPDMTAYFMQGGDPAPYGFFQQVRSGSKGHFQWHYTSGKFLKDSAGNQSANLVLVSNPVAGMGLMVNKVAKLLDENVYVAGNYKKFLLLTKREKEIIGLLAEGKTTMEISDHLFISHHTVSTHRKNITNKLELKTFSELLKFAAAFELVRC